MNVPNLPTNVRVAQADGTIHPDFLLWLTQWVTQTQKNWSQEGLTIPTQTTANMTILAPMKTAAFLYNKEADKMYVNNAGTFKEIATV
jgi:hypothetical protein